jgi:hypothetical protein
MEYAEAVADLFHATVARDRLTSLPYRLMEVFVFLFQIVVGLRQ